MYTVERVAEISNYQAAGVSACKMVMAVKAIDRDMMSLCDLKSPLNNVIAGSPRYLCMTFYSFNALS